MNIVMHCGGMPFNGDTIKKESLGGSETAAYYLAKELAKRGHRVTLFTNSPEEGTFDEVKYICAGAISEAQPLGARFHFYAAQTPHDVCIVQRNPVAFSYHWASKLNFLWLHDLGLYRHREMFQAQMWNVDGVFTVSGWHAAQVREAYGLTEEIVMPITNGVDPGLFKGPLLRQGIVEVSTAAEKADGKCVTLPIPEGQFPMLYSSRPERGLEHLVRPGGIMERLLETNPEAHLYVCSYDNKVAHMAGYYDALYARIEALPNCTNLGSLTKQQLADVMRQCALLVYPTEFEEVSCITAMEAMHAGLPFLSSRQAALPETCKGSGAILLPLKDSAADEDAFVREIKRLMKSEKLDDIRSAQLSAAQKYTWANVAEQVERHIQAAFHDRTMNPERVARHLVEMSDIHALQEYRATTPAAVRGGFPKFGSITEEVDRLYRFAFDNKFKEHYEAYYEYEKARGVNYGPEVLDGNARFEHVSSLIAALPDGAVVLDYGCAHGHYTVNLAKRFPGKQFVGVDLAASNVAKATEWAGADKVGNVRFCEGAVTGGKVCSLDGLPLWDAEPSLKFDAVIAAEVLEHVNDSYEVACALEAMLKPDGLMITTTPFGPWEAQGYKQHHPWRAHLHHFERADLAELFGDRPGYTVAVAPSGSGLGGQMMGSYIASFRRTKDDAKLTEKRRVNYARKLRTLNPRQTLSVCIIARDAELSLGRTLESVKDIADEIIVAVDENTRDATREIAEKYAKGFRPKGELVFDIKSPLETGFDEARNTCIARASGDWVMWIDSDEVLFHPENVLKYLRGNMYSGYAVKQHHFSVAPAGVIKTDLPCRFFRNHRGVRFFGVVHEHPEVALNEGLGAVLQMNDVEIAHYGYSTEEVRRRRFERNIGLLQRDRKVYPERLLGKMLWLRDLAQMSMYELEHNGGQVTEAMQQRAEAGIKLWEELLASNNLRMAVDSIEYYSMLVKLTHGGFDFGMQLDVSKLNGGAHPEKSRLIGGRFAKREHADKLFAAIMSERTKHYDSKYY